MGLDRAYLSSSIRSLCYLLCMTAKIKIELTNQSGCKFVFDGIPDVNTPKDMKDYLWNDVTTNHLFKSREELDTDWGVKIL